jgi:hypothetical protein
MYIVELNFMLILDYVFIMIEKQKTWNLYILQ